MILHGAHNSARTRYEMFRTGYDMILPGHDRAVEADERVRDAVGARWEGEGETRGRCVRVTISWNTIRYRT